MSNWNNNNNQGGGGLKKLYNPCTIYREDHAILCGYNKTNLKCSISIHQRGQNNQFDWQNATKYVSIGKGQALVTAKNLMRIMKGDKPEFESTIYLQNGEFSKLVVKKSQSGWPLIETRRGTQQGITDQWVVMEFRNEEELSEIIDFFNNIGVFVACRLALESHPATAGGTGGTQGGGGWNNGGGNGNWNNGGGNGNWNRAPNQNNSPGYYNQNNQNTPPQGGQPPQQQAPQNNSGPAPQSDDGNIFD